MLHFGWVGANFCIFNTSSLSVFTAKGFASIHNRQRLCIRKLCNSNLFFCGLTAKSLFEKAAPEPSLLFTASPEHKAIVTSWSEHLRNKDKWILTSNLCFKLVTYALATHLQKHKEPGYKDTFICNLFHSLHKYLYRQVFLVHVLECFLKSLLATNISSSSLIWSVL